MLLIPTQPLPPQHKYLPKDGIAIDGIATATKAAYYYLHTEDAIASIPVSLIDSSNTYYPEINDLVIGTIVDKTHDYYTVEARGTDFFILNSLEFEGATKKNKPDLEVCIIMIGQTIYTRVLAINQYERSELSCISPFHKKAWNTGESFFGPLIEGFAFSCSKMACHE